jgi:diadenosine tetraphosphate (Ap4A) HIT family hydrolase
MTTCPICESINKARSGLHPLLIAELSETFAILGDNQGCPGWTVLLLKDHQEHLAALPTPRQLRIFEDVAAAANAIRQVFGPVRINYECLGNQVPHIHWHIIPRHQNDPTPTLPVWGWTPTQLRGNLTDEQRLALRDRIRSGLPPL